MLSRLRPASGRTVVVVLAVLNRAVSLFVVPTIAPGTDVPVRGC